jgi:hypothetical protein
MNSSLTEEVGCAERKKLEVDEGEETEELLKLKSAENVKSL